jgi:putative membrane protein
VSELATTLVVLVAVLHAWFLVLEMFLWTRPIGLRTFRNTEQTARTMAVLCVVVAGCFGALTASKRILYVQAVPALVALVLVFLG